jgi:hypothetical protein
MSDFDIGIANHDAMTQGCAGNFRVKNPTLSLQTAEGQGWGTLEFESREFLNLDRQTAETRKLLEGLNERF